MPMKSILVTIALLLATLALFAQDDISEIKPQTKGITAEMNFDPFSGNALSINYLRFRMFLSSEYAYRMGFAVSFRTETPQVDVKRNYYSISLRPGFEKHFEGTDRLSPYLGVELDLAIKRAQIVNDGPGTFAKIDGAWSDNGQERGFTRLGFNVLVGADFYFAKHFYVGTEFGFGVQNVKNSDIEITPTGSTNVITVEGGSGTQLGPIFNSSMRLGFVF